MANEQYKIMLRHAVSGEIREYVFPDDAPRMVSDLVWWIPELSESRSIGAKYNVDLSLTAVAGWVGPYLEIRRIPMEDK